MNTRTILLLSAALLCTLTSCGNTESGQSTPIDSTNMAGVAPAQYTEGTPDTRIDTTIQQRDAMREDSAGQRTLPQNSPNGSGANTSNTSNTSDKRTTSGSANNGDADKDRKK